MHQISIIIPAYNCEKQISRCLDSVISQTYSDFECIIIDDGSIDGTESVCKKYVSKDERFVYLKQNNAGASAARNTGLDLCKSKYVCFIDADDYVSPSYLMDLMSDVDSNDLVIHGMTRICSDRIIDRGMHIEGEFCLDNNPTCFFESVNIERFGGPYCKLYNIDILKKYDIYFNTKVRLAEDLDFLLRYLLHCSTIKVSPRNNYFYIETQNSVSSNIYDFETEYIGLVALSHSWNRLTEKYSNAVLYDLSQKSISYLIHRALFSIFSSQIKIFKKYHYVRMLGKRYRVCYGMYYKPTTRFLQLIKFLFSKQIYISLTLVLTLRYKFR